MASSLSSPVAAGSALLLAVTLLLHSLVPCLTQSAPPEVKISTVDFRGAGCNPTNTEYVISPDRLVLTLLFSNMNVSMEDPEGRWKNCHVTIGLNFTVGWIFSVVDVTPRGYADLERGVAGTHKVKFHISGQNGTAHSSYTIHGPYQDNYEFRKSFNTTIWSVCDDPHNLNFDTSVSINGPDGSKGVMTVDTEDHTIGLLLHIAWNQCV